MFQYRNHHEKHVDFSPSLTIIVGENGKGKTNILEAVYSLAITKPFRNSTKEVFIEYEQDWARVQGVFREDTEAHQSKNLEVFWGNKNQCKCNDIVLSPREYMREKKFLAVLFSPEDMNLPFLSPLIRRRYLSQVLSPLFPDYLSASLKYSAVIKNRNQLLKQFSDGKVERNEFLFWDSELVKYHSILTQYHLEFCEYINSVICTEYQSIAGKEEHVFMKYLPKTLRDQNTNKTEYNDESDDYFEKALRQSFDKDVFRGSTSVGVHRDDFEIQLRGVNISEGASRGECRSALLALKKSEKKFLQNQSNTQPLILLDDVFSELDIHHQKHLLESLKGYQSIITTTEMNIDISNFEDVKVLEV